MIYLHGLLGSAKNWRSIALSKDVIARMKIFNFNK